MRSFLIQEINKILQKKHKDTDGNKEETQFRKQMAILPYTEDVTDKISHELKKWQIKTAFSAPGKVQQFIGNVQDPIAAWTNENTPCKEGWQPANISGSRTGVFNPRPAALGRVLCGPGRVFHKIKCVINIEA